MNKAVWNIDHKFIRIRPSFLAYDLPDIDYDIDLKRIPDQAALLNWILHLSEKSWMRQELIRQFILEVYHSKGWERQAV